MSTATGEFVRDAKRCGWGYLAGKRATTARCQPHFWQEITDRAVDFGSVRHVWRAVQFSFAADRRGRSVRHHPKMRFSTTFRLLIAMHASLPNGIGIVRNAKPCPWPNNSKSATE